MAKKSITFEESMKRLDEIVSALESGEVSLEESLKLFEEGTKLSVKCTELLDTAELKVTALMKGPDGSPVEQELSNDEV